MCAFWAQANEEKRRLTARSAVVADDRQEVIGRDLGDALLGQERPEVQPFQGEGDVAVDLEGVHDLVPEALQVDAQDLREGRNTVQVAGALESGTVT